MTDVEALLSVDAGHIPGGTSAFFRRDPEAASQRRLVLASVVLGTATLALVVAGVRQILPLLLGAAAGIFAASAASAVRGGLEPDARRPWVMVVTPTAIVMRGEHGLQTWTLADLAAAPSWRYAGRVDMFLVRKDGTRSFIDCRAFYDGERIPEAIAEQLSRRAPPA